MIYLSVSILSTPKNKNYKVTISPRTNVVNNIVTVENINYLIKCEPTTFDKQNAVTQEEDRKTVGQATMVDYRNHNPFVGRGSQWNISQVIPVLEDLQQAIFYKC